MQDGLRGPLDDKSADSLFALRSCCSSDRDQLRLFPLRLRGPLPGGQREPRLERDLSTLRRLDVGWMEGITMSQLGRDYGDQSRTSLL